MKLFKFTIKTFLRYISLLFVACFIAYLLVSLSPIDPVQAYIGAGIPVSAEQRQLIEEYWGLDKGPIQGFLHWANAALHGDFGVSVVYRQPVLEVISERFLNSLALMGTAWILSGAIGFSIGIIMGRYRDSMVDKTLKTICIVISSTPVFWLGMVFLMIFSYKLSWFPIGMSVPAGVPVEDVTFMQKVYHLILPALTLSFASFPRIALHTREKLIDVYNMDYMILATARGENERTRLLRHAVPNILIPFVTLQFLSFAEIFGGSIMCEQVFSYPGLGSAAIAAGLNSDAALLLGITIFSALFVFIGNLTANLLYSLINPQIREGIRNEA